MTQGLNASWQVVFKRELDIDGSPGRKVKPAEVQQALRWFREIGRF